MIATPAPTPAPLEQPTKPIVLPSSNIAVSEVPAPGGESEPLEAIGYDIAVRQGDKEHNLIYGEVRVGGLFSFLAQPETDNQFTHIFITVSAHEIEDITALYLDGEEVTFGGGTINTDARWGLSGSKWDDKIFMAKSLGTTSQAANADLLSQSAAHNLGWTVDHRQRGRGGSYLIITFDENMLPNADGLPEIQFKVKGKKLYDPREGGHDPDDDSTWEYSNNAVLAAVDYIRFAFNVSYSSFDNAQIIAAANVADESVNLNGGGSEARYTVNGQIKTSDDRLTNLRKFESAIGGRIYNQNGTWYVVPASWTTPTGALDVSDARGSVKVRVLETSTQAINLVRGKYVDADTFEIADFPPVSNATYLAQDGKERAIDVTYPLTTSAATAQRLAKLKIEDNRQGIILEGVWGLEALPYIPGDNIPVTHARLGWSGKYFRVIASKFYLAARQSGAPEILVALQLKETAEAVFDWADGEETTVDLAPNTNLPDPSVVADIAGLTLASGNDEMYLRGDGTIAAGLKVSWTPVSDMFVLNGGQIEVQYKRTYSDDAETVANSTWLSAGYIDGELSTTTIRDIKSGKLYDVRVRNINAIGNKGAWSTELFFLAEGKEAAPSDVVNLQANVESYTIRITWDHVSDIDLKHYVIKNGNEVLGVAYTNSFVWSMQAAGSYNLSVYAEDTSGNISENAATTTASIDSPGAPGVAAAIDGTDVVLSWPEVAEPENGYAVDAYEISYGSTYGSATPLNETKSSHFRVRVSWGDTRRFWVVTRDVAGNRSSEVSVDVDIAAPGAPSSFSVSSNIDNNVGLSWGAPVGGSLPVAKYKVYKGATVATGILLGDITGTFKNTSESIAGTYTYLVTAVDSAGNESPAASVTVSVSAPPNYVLIDNALVGGEFSETTNALVGMRGSTLDEYDVLSLEPTLWLKADAGITKDGSDRVATWADQSGNGFDFTQSTEAAKPIYTENELNGLPVIRFDGSDDEMTSAATMGDFIDAGSFTVLVAAVINGTSSNVGGAYNNHALFGTTSGAMNIHARTNDVVYCGIYDGGDKLVGRSYTEGDVFIFRARLDGGSIYVDLDGGSESSTASGDASGLANSCFLGRDDNGDQHLEFDLCEMIVFDSVLSDAKRDEIERYLNFRWQPKENRYTTLESAGVFILPVDVDATLAENVTDSGAGNTTIQDMIDDGYSHPFQPTPNTCEVQRVIDYGAVLASSLITLTWNKTNIAGNVDLEAQIDYSSDGTSWTSATAGETEVFASNFRFVRITITGTPDDDTSFARLENVRVRLDVKKGDESGKFTANAGDSGGTTVTFSENWIDVELITITPFSSSQLDFAVDFTDVPNPTSFKVLVWDQSGTRQTVNCGYTVKGVKSNE